jgi:arginine/serine-rich splicing factor 4/5/6
MSNRVFVGKISQSTSEQTLNEEFSKCGEVTKIDLKNGYAFVFFANEDHCNDAISMLNGKDIDGSNIVVEAARARDFNRQKPVKRLDLRLSVTGLDDRVSWQDMKDWARKAGDVTFTNIFVKDGAHMGVIEFAVWPFGMGGAAVRCSTFGTLLFCRTMRAWKMHCAPWMAFR